MRTRQFKQSQGVLVWNVLLEGYYNIRLSNYNCRHFTGTAIPGATESLALPLDPMASTRLEGPYPGVVISPLLETFAFLSWRLV